MASSSNLNHPGIYNIDPSSDYKKIPGRPPAFGTDFTAVTTQAKSTKFTPLLRCNRSTVEPPDPSTVFDYPRFTYFLKCCNALEKLDRRLAIRHARKVSQLEDFTDEVLTTEMFRMYGEMATESAHFVKLFNVYKEERLEEISEWIDEEDDMIYDLLASGRKVIDLNYQIPEDETIDLQTEFTPEEFQIFSSVAQGAKAGAERFILPRKELKTVDQVRNLNSGNINFAQFDPQISLPASALPYASDDCTASEQIISRLHSQIRKHPDGITLTSFFTEFRELNGYELDFENFGYPDFGAMIHDLSHIIWSQSMEGYSSLLYPTTVQGLICTPRELFWKILHRLYFILTFSNGIVCVEDAFEMSEQIFGFKIEEKTLKAWGFASLHGFAHFLFKYFQHNEIKLVHEHEIRIGGGGTDSAPKLFIIRETEHIREEINQARRKHVSQSQNRSRALVPSVENSSSVISEPQKFTSKNIPDSCLKAGDHLEWESDLVFTGQETRCVLTYHVSPVDFQVVLLKQWNYLEEFQDELAQTYKQEQYNYLKVNPTHLSKGIYLVALTEDPEYIRVIYVGKGSGSRHKVTSIDYGYDLEVSEEKLMYLLRPFSHKIHAQSIPCSLYNVQPQKNSQGKPTFEKSVIDKSYKLLWEPSGPGETIRPITVSFKTKTTEIVGKPQWLVRVCGANRAQVPDVGRVIMELIRTSESAKANPTPRVNPIQYRGNPQLQASSIVDPNKRIPWGNTASASANPIQNGKLSTGASFCTTVPELKDSEKPSWVKDREIVKTVGKFRNISQPIKPPASYANVASSSKPEINKNAQKSLNFNTPAEEFPTLLAVTKPRRKKT